MNEENLVGEENLMQQENIIQKDKIVQQENIIQEDIKTSYPEIDISKIKIRNILAQRIKNSKSKHTIAIIILAAICFFGGILTDRLIMRHEIGRDFYGKPGIQRRMPGNFNNKKGNKIFNNNMAPSQNQSQQANPNTQTQQTTPNSPPKQ